MEFVPSDAVEVRQAGGKGLGIFARRPIPRGEVIERVPLLIMDAEDYARGVDQSLLARYVFHWGEGQIALALGYGSLYNHSYRPNAKYEDEAPQAKRFVAIREIESGEEVTVNYNGTPKSRKKLWFEIAEETRPPRARRETKPKG